MAVEFYIAKMSDHMETAQILKWLVNEGDRVEQYQIILELMTDKVTAEVEAPAAGVIKGIRPGAVDGAEVPVGEVICYIAAPGESVPALPPLPGYETPDEGRTIAEHPSGTKDEEPVAQVEIAPKEGEAEPVAGPRASPVARRVAKDLSIDLTAVTGTGPQGRITEADVRAFATAKTDERRKTKDEPVAPTPTAPAVSAPEHISRIPHQDMSPSTLPAPRSTDLPLTPVQRITGERMRESVVNAPQFAIDVAADMTQALWLREQINERIEAEAGAKLSVTGLLVKVVGAALKHHPRANAEFAGAHLKVHEEINVAVAVGTDDGLVVPVIRSADRKSLSEITRELAGFQEKARTLRFTAEDLSGGTFTLSNLGMFGVDNFRAIINPPQSAILAVGRIQKTPMGLPDDTIALRPMMSLTLTVDHRCLDGVQAARLLAEIKDLLERPHLLLA
jgi:pyruvate dehydrogenase E2 component (dihydrolipoamide acetyltransferase)